jgi:hypothetical protein
MFRLEFKSKKEAKEWEVTLTKAGDVCREKGIKCEYFGSEPSLVDEGKGGEEGRVGSPSLSKLRRSESQRSASSPTASQRSLSPS